MPKNRNDFLFIKTDNREQTAKNELYNEKTKYLKTHTLKDTLSTPLEQMRYENEKAINERDF